MLYTNVKPAPQPLLAPRRRPARQPAARRPGGAAPGGLAAKLGGGDAAGAAGGGADYPQLLERILSTGAAQFLATSFLATGFCALTRAEFLATSFCALSAMRRARPCINICAMWAGNIHGGDMVRATASVLPPCNCVLAGRQRAAGVSCRCRFISCPFVPIPAHCVPALSVQCWRRIGPRRWARCSGTSLAARCSRPCCVLRRRWATRECRSAAPRRAAPGCAARGWDGAAGPRGLGGCRAGGRAGAKSSGWLLGAGRVGKYAQPAWPPARVLEPSRAASWGLHPPRAPPAQLTLQDSFTLHQHKQHCHVKRGANLITNLQKTTRASAPPLCVQRPAAPAHAARAGRALPGRPAARRAPCAHEGPRGQPRHGGERMSSCVCESLHGHKRNGRAAASWR